MVQSLLASVGTACHNDGPGIFWGSYDNIAAGASWREAALYYDSI